MWLPEDMSPASLQTPCSHPPRLSLLLFVRLLHPGRQRTAVSRLEPLKDILRWSSGHACVYTIF